jgi:lipid II:glycine glycyltransferase (peptidoglycan interpeptide bridge formation enzyme)
MLNIKQITDENFGLIWNKFVAENSSPSSFLQSFEWAEFKSKTQNPISKTQENVFRYAVYNNTELIAAAQFLKMGLPGGKFYLNCAKGPVVKMSNVKCQMSNESEVREIIDLIIGEIKKIVKKEEIVFVRFALPYEKNYELRIMNYGFQKTKILVNLKEPENTLIIDLKKGEEEILAGMRQKTRYNIKLAEKKNVVIRNWKLETREKDIDIFYNLMKETAKRDGINIFSKEYYKNLIESFCCHSGLRDGIQKEAHGSRVAARDDKINSNLFLAEFKNKPLAGILVFGFGDTATYFYGASGNVGRELMPNYLLQWEAIKWAKENGYRWYDMWGITPNFQDTSSNFQINSKFQIPNSKHDWAGITRFKMGFVSENTGKEINYIPTMDLVLNKFWYNLYRIGKLFKR